MLAGSYDLSIDEGSTFVQPLVLTDPQTLAPIDLTGYTATSQIRSTYDATMIIAEITCTIPNPTDGTIILNLTDTQTVLDPILFPKPTGRSDIPVKAVWDIFITKAGVATRLLKGLVLFYPRVTAE